MVIQSEITIKASERGFHIITDQVLDAIPEIKEVRAGILNVFIKHTSASLAINENADPSVRRDLESHFNEMVPEDAPYYLHTFEGPDDMPAHIKAIMIGSSIQIPVTLGQLNLGMWQGIYLCEHRNRPTARDIVITLTGDFSLKS